MDKPTKPTDLMPRTFGGLKENFSASLQETGVEPNVPVIYHGRNFNYERNAIGQELDYCEKIADFINGIPIGKTITVDSNNKLQYADLATDVTIDEETIILNEDNELSVNSEQVQLKSDKGQFDGYCPLDDKGLVPKEHLPIDTNLNITNCVAEGNLDNNGDLDLIDADVASETVIEKKQAGTYTFEIETAGTYSIALVGGGGGGGAKLLYPGINNIVRNVSGGSGAGFVGDVTLEAGIYTVTVGAGGDVGNGVSKIGTPGGDTKLSLNGVDLIVAGGGKCPAKGTLTIDDNIISGTPTIQTDGNPGSTHDTNGYPSGVGYAGGASVYSPYGAGGYSNNSSGGTGYFKITLSTASSTIVEYNVTPSTPLTIITPQGEKQTIDGVNPDDITSLADGVYHKFVDATSSEFLKNTIVYNPTTLTGLSDNDIVIYTGEPIRVYKIVSGALVEYQKVLIGTVTISSGNITEIEEVEKGFNNNIFNNFNGKSAYVIDTIKIGTSVCRIWSDGFCEQSGKISVPSTNTTTTVILLKSFKDLDYNVYATNNVSSVTWNQMTDLQILQQGLSSFKISANVPNNTVNWKAEGYIK